MKTFHATSPAGYSLCLLLAFLLIGTLPLSARILPTGIGLRTMLSGNGISTAPALTFQYAGTNWEWELGADLQLRKPHFSGMQTTLCYYPMRKNIQGLRLGFFTNIHYSFAALMNKNVIEQESFLAPERRMQINEMHLRIIEGQAGFILRIFHTKDLSTYYGVGFGAYQTLGDEDDYVLIHREFNHAQLVLNFGINYNFCHQY